MSKPQQESPNASAPLSRRDAIERAAGAVDHLERWMGNRGLVLPECGLTPAIALFSLLVKNAADVLQGHGSNATPKHRRSRVLLYRARERGRDVLAVARGDTRWQGDEARWSRAALRVLAIPRQKSHLRDLFLVGEAARDRDGSAVRFLLFRHAHQEEATRRALVGALAVGGPELLARRQLRSQIYAATSAPPPPGMDPRTWRAVLRVCLTTLRAHRHLLTTVVAAIARAIERSQPTALLIGNPCTTEGAVATAIGRRLGIRTVAIQHGEVAATQLEWSRARMDVLTAWGELSRQRLIALGVPKERVVVTGAPWVDALRARVTGLRPPREGRRLLVALSGAGHSVGMTEHLAQVRLLAGAVREVPEAHWIFRLHPKDDAEIYRSALAGIPADRVEIVPSAKGGDIHEQLATVDGLITVLSASALDAFLQSVPVVTLGRPEGEHPPAFSLAGATVAVPFGESPGPALRRLLAAGPPPEISARARRYAEDCFGPLDGGASQRILRLLEPG